MKFKTSWTELIRRAKAVGEAKKSGDEEQIKEAEAELESYRQLCLQADEMILPYTRGGLS